MPDAPLSALANIGGASAELGALQLGLHLSERRLGQLLHLEGTRDCSAIATALASLGIAALPQLGRCVGHETCRMLCIGPLIYLLIREPQLQDTALTLDRRLGRAFTAAIDVSHAWTRLVIEGPKATDLLAKGCALDLHSRSFPPGNCAGAAMAHMRVILSRVRVEEFHLLIGRSYAVSLWEWLRDASAEFLTAPDMVR
jgi:sarcosine oxidase, subunit gamma